MIFITFSHAAREQRTCGLAGQLVKMLVSGAKILMPYDERLERAEALDRAPEVFPNRLAEQRSRTCAVSV